jgi:hypothetical protein
LLMREAGKAVALDSIMLCFFVFLSHMTHQIVRNTKHEPTGLYFLA